MWVRHIHNNFCPNLIANDLVLVSPMSSMTGYITYLSYTAGSNKGATKQGDVFNNPFRLGKVDPDYTSSRVVETVTLAANVTVAGQTGVGGKLAWKPVAAIHTVTSGTRNDDIPFYWGRTAIRTSLRTPAYGSDAENAAALDFQQTIDPSVFKVLSTDGLVDWTDVTVVNAQTGEFLVDGASAGDEVKVAYVYDNVVVPQQDIPMLNVTMEGIALMARARRIAVYYSQIAAFQAKTDYGLKLYVA